MASNSGRKLIGGRWVRWDDARARQAHERGLWVRHTLADSLREAAQESPRRVLLVDGEHNIDCSALYEQSAALAGWMLARAPAGSVVSFMLPNWHEAAVIYMAATLAGMVANPILPSLRDRDLRFIFEDAQTRFVFAPASFRQHDYAEMLSRVNSQLPRPPEVVILRGEARNHIPYASLPDRASGPQEFPSVDADAVRMILYTSGTTGRPKGVLHSHNSLHALITQLREHWLIERGDKFLIPSPIGHIGGSIYAFECPVLLGTTGVLMERWNAEEAVALIDKERCTHMAGATPFLQQLLVAAQSVGTRLPTLKLFVCGGASVPPSLIADAAAYFEHAIVTRVYGSTEVPVTTVGATRRDEIVQAANTDGRPGLAEVKLADQDSLPTAEGEIRARGPQMLVGYLHEEDEIESFDADGFFRTGDLARRVDGKYLVVTGRAKDLIIRNGENISPKEIEDILVGHPEIAEIAIVGLPDARTGERACAVIVPRKLPGPGVASLRSFLEAQGVAAFKVPEQVVISETLPRNDAGKVLKHRLREQLGPAAAPKK
jgi:acyl-CoA synthetase (AMP-forming)/AMP-acid ligase II